jgi:hypothetical protein
MINKIAMEVSRDRNNCNYGFIITRHVNNETTNQYWNECIQCIRQCYPLKKIIVIDDNSKQEYIKALAEYENIEYVQSEFLGRGELLPYYYLWKHKYFDYAIILHDSVFLQKRINIEYLINKQIKVMPLWHFTHEKKENFNNTLRIAQQLVNNFNIINTLAIDREYEVLGNKKNVWTGCFGVQSFIHHGFLCMIQKKYNLFNLLNYVTTRGDRCGLERVVGVIFYIEYLKEIGHPSLLGDIHSYGLTWGFNFKNYKDYKVNTNMKRCLPIIKVWSGR